MTKKEFLKFINGKKVVIENKKDIQKIVLDTYFEIKDNIEWINKEKNVNIKIVKNENGAYFLNTGEVLRVPLLRALQVHSRGLETIVRSKDIIINGCHFDIKNIIVLSDNTFKSAHRINNNIEVIFKIVS